MTSRDGGPLLRAREEARAMLRLAQICSNAEDVYSRQARRRCRELPEGVPAHDLSKAGWGIIYAHDERTRGMKELEELTEKRSLQAGSRFKSLEFDGTKDPQDFLYEVLESSPGTIDPMKTPYYWLLVGSPEQIPFDIQYALSVNHSVGRIYFENPEQYRHYARAVVEAEGGAATPRRVDLFAVEKPGDRAIAILTEYLIEPLLQFLNERMPEWKSRCIRGDDGTLKVLMELLSGADTPGVLLAACHGLKLPFGDPDQKSLQGALSCLDGVFDASYLDALNPDSRSLHGLIAFLFACYGAGTPCIDSYPTEVEGEWPAPQHMLSEEEFIALLPQAMLANGALAVVGHVDRGWALSFRWLHRGYSIEASRSLKDSIVRLLQGQRLGHALRPLFRRYSSVVAQMLPLLEAAEYGLNVNLRNLRVHKVAATDARGYIILGDPAVYALGKTLACQESLASDEQTPNYDEARQVFLDPGLLLDIRVAAKNQGMSPQQWLHEALRRQLKAPTPGRGSGIRDGGMRWNS